MIHFLSLEHELHSPISEIGHTGTHSACSYGVNEITDCTYSIRSVSSNNHSTVNIVAEGYNCGFRTSWSTVGVHSGPRIDGELEQGGYNQDHKINAFIGVR